MHAKFFLIYIFAIQKASLGCLGKKFKNNENLNEKFK
jgi:hypothetical protein